MFGFQRNQRNQRQENHRRGTVLILCVVLLVILGTVAMSFVLLSFYQRAASRSLSRADDFEQVRQTSLTYVRTLLLQDLLGDNGQFLDGDTDDEAYDSPGGADLWLSAHGVATTNPEIDTDGDNTDDSRWIDSATIDPQFPGFASFASGQDSDGNATIVASDGTQYRVAIRIVDTNALANINVGMADTSGSSGIAWDGQYPYHLDLRSPSLLEQADVDEGRDPHLDDGGSVDGRIPGYGNLYTALTNDLYPYIANPNPPTTIRPFDLAEEIALRMEMISGVNLHSRLQELWPSTFGSNNDLLTAYSWTMQIRPATNPVAGLDPDEIDAALADLGYPAPCKILLGDLVASEDARKAVYLALLAAGMTADQAAAFLVNLIDYVDNDNDIELIDSDDDGNSTVIDFVDWQTVSQWPYGLTFGTNGIPSTARNFYGTDTQPIISEVYVKWHYIDDGNGPDVNGDYTYMLDPDISTYRYAVELYNPTDQDFDLTNWELAISGSLGSPYDLSSAPDIPAHGFLVLVSHGDNIPVPPAPLPANVEVSQISGLVIYTGPQTIELTRLAPDNSDVTVDRLAQTFDSATVPGPGPSQTATRTEDFQRPGNNYAGNLIPAIANFQKIDFSASPSGASLGDYPDPSVVDVSADDLNNQGQGAQIVFPTIPDNQLHSLGELFYVLRIADDGTGTQDPIVVRMQNAAQESEYRLDPGDTTGNDQKVLQYLTLRTGLNDNADNDGDTYIDNQAFAPDESVVLEARVPGLININTASDDVLYALHYYFGLDPGEIDISGGGSFASVADFAQFLATTVGGSKDEDPDGEGIGSPDGILFDNEQNLFHFKNVANLISVRSDVFIVYITIQASDRDGIFGANSPTLRTMAILDRSFCLRPTGTLLAEIPLPRILAQTTLP